MVVALFFAAYAAGFNWFEGLDLATQKVRVGQGWIDRPAWYFWFANLAALALAIGPATCAALAWLRRDPLQCCSGIDRCGRAHSIGVGPVRGRSRADIPSVRRVVAAGRRTVASSRHPMVADRAGGGGDRSRDVPEPVVVIRRTETTRRDLWFVFVDGNTQPAGGTIRVVVAYVWSGRRFVSPLGASIRTKVVFCACALNGNRSPGIQRSARVTENAFWRGDAVTSTFSPTAM